MKRRALLLTAMPLLLTAGTAAAADGVAATGRRYSVMSLVGDRLDVVTYRLAAGTNRDANVHNPVALEGGVFDKAALLSVERALARTDRTAAVQLLAVAAPEAFERQNRFFEGGKATLPPSIDAAARSGGSTHLVLVTKYRHEANLQLADSKTGSGMLEGLGFYIDRAARMIESGSGQHSIGFLAPFAYIKLTLIDLQTSTVVRQLSGAASTTFAASRAKQGADPWDALEPAEKIDVLRRLLTEEVERLIPELVAGL